MLSNSIHLKESRFKKRNEITVSLKFKLERGKANMEIIQKLTDHVGVAKDKTVLFQQ